LQTVEFYPAETAREVYEIAKKEKVKIDQSVIENIARLSEGYLRDSLSLLGQILALGEKNIDKETASLVLPRSDWQEVLKFISLLIDKDGRQAVELVNKLFEEGIDLEHFTAITIESLRKVLYAKITGDWQAVSWEFGAEWLKPLAKQAEKISAGELVKMIEILMIAFLDVKKAQIIQLPLEMAAVAAANYLSVKTASDKQQPPDDKNSGCPATDSSLISSLSGFAQTPVQPPTINLEVKTIRQKWPEIILALKDYNHSLASFLMVGAPSAVEADRIIVGFQYNFHAERVKEKKNLEIINSVLLRVFGCPIFLEARVDENFKPEKLIKNEDLKKADQQMVNDVLNAFGGEVVG